MLRRIVTLVALAGCDFVFRLDDVSVPDTADAADAADAADGADATDAPTCFHEPFSGGLVELAVNWTRYSDDTTAATPRNNALAIVIQANAGSDYGGILFNKRFDLSGRSVSVEARAVLPAGNGEGIYAVRLDVASWFGIVANSSDISFRQRVQSIDRDVTSLGYDAIEHRYWRIAHAAGFVRFSTSADGENWVERAAFVPILPIGALDVNISAGSYNAGYAMAQTAVYDELRICPAP